MFADGFTSDERDRIKTLERENKELRYRTATIPGNWRNDAGGALFSNVRGETWLQSAYAQDAWAFAPRWKTVLGARLERWSASNGLTDFSASSALAFPSRSESYVSPKAALSYQWAPDTLLKVSAGRAVRFPTVGELYGATSTANSQYINDPNLRPEKSLTTELTAEKDLGSGLVRLTFFTENTRDALYSQSVFDPLANLKTSLAARWRSGKSWAPAAEGANRRAAGDGASRPPGGKRSAQRPKGREGVMD